MKKNLFGQSLPKDNKNVLRKDRIYSMIKKRMNEYHSAFNKSLKNRKILESYRKDSEDFKTLFDKVVESEIRCIELDEIIFRLYTEYKSL